MLIAGVNFALKGYRRLKNGEVGLMLLTGITGGSRGYHSHAGR